MDFHLRDGSMEAYIFNGTRMISCNLMLLGRDIAALHLHLAPAVRMGMISCNLDMMKATREIRHIGSGDRHIEIDTARDLDRTPSSQLLQLPRPARALPASSNQLLHLYPAQAAPASSQQERQNQQASIYLSRVGCDLFAYTPICLHVYIHVHVNASICLYVSISIGPIMSTCVSVAMV